MPVVVVENRERLASFFRRNASAHAYELGDLDDFDWPHTRWFGWEVDGSLQQVALLYTQPDVPVLVAIADPPTVSMERLLAAILDALPPAVYAHATAPLLATLAARYEIVESAAHLKLALGQPDRIAEHVVDADALGAEDLEEIQRFYVKAYPGTWFVPRMLATGRYLGIRRSGDLVCVVGVHVCSPEWGVAALGNVATLPELRGQGLARGACAALCRLLLDDGIETIALNVRADNADAIRSYERLGFERAAEYVEASLVAR